MSQLDWFKDDGDKKFEELPEGIYPVTITNATLDETKDEPRLSVEFTLASRRKVWLNLRFSETGKKFLNWQMRELGVYDHAKELAIAGKTIPHAFLDAVAGVIGAECSIEISYRDCQGKRFQNVKMNSMGALTTAEKTDYPAANKTIVNHAPTANAPAFKADEEMPDFMR